MDIIKSRIITVFVFFILLMTSCTEKPLRFVPLTQFNTTDTTTTPINRSEYYIVENFQDDIRSEKQIDSFINRNKNPNLKSYGYYVIGVYKSSSITNVEHLRDNPRDIDRYSQKNDWIYTYIWSNGTFSGKEKIKNGIIVSPEVNIKSITIK